MNTTTARADVLEVGDRVEAGEGDDHDTGKIISIDESTGLAMVAWDTMVVTSTPLEILTKADA